MAKRQRVHALAAFPGIRLVPAAAPPIRSPATGADSPGRSWTASTSPWKCPPSLKPICNRRRRASPAPPCANGFVAGESTDALADILAALTDGFYATLTVATGADEYTAWVMTTQTKAVRRYRDFPFNSFAVLDGELWGAAADGIYRMGGTTDAGAAIAAA